MPQNGANPFSVYGRVRAQHDAPVRFGYAVVPAGVSWYVIQAVNQHNPKSHQYAVLAASSVATEIVSQNEQE